MRKLFPVMLAAMACPSLAMGVTSPDIVDGKPLKLEQVYIRCGGSNISPALFWSGAPAGTKSFALTVIDVSVKPSGWSHWIVTGIPANVRKFDRGIVRLPKGATGVKSDFGDLSYDGPCPPTGSGIHRYEFTIWALDTPAVTLRPGAPAAEIEAALGRSALAKAALSGTVER